MSSMFQSFARSSCCSYTAMPCEVDEEESQVAVCELISDNESERPGEFQVFRVEPAPTVEVVEMQHFVVPPGQTHKSEEFECMSVTGTDLENGTLKTPMSECGAMLKRLPVLKAYFGDWQYWAYPFYANAPCHLGALTAGESRIPENLRDLFAEARQVLDEDVRPIEGNIYRYAAFFIFGALDTRYRTERQVVEVPMIADKASPPATQAQTDAAEDFVKGYPDYKDEPPTEEIFVGLPRPCYQWALMHGGLAGIIFLQVFTPIFLLWIYIAEFWKSLDGDNDDEPQNRLWPFGKAANHHWEYQDWMITILGWVFLLVVQGAVFFRIVKDARSAKLLHILASGLYNLGEPVCVMWLIIDALVNCAVAVMVSIASFFLIYNQTSVEDVLLNSVALLFLNNLDDVGSDFGFLEGVWDEVEMGRFAVAYVNAKLHGKVETRHEDDNENERTWPWHCYTGCPVCLYSFTQVVLLCCLIAGFFAIFPLAGRLKPSDDTPDSVKELRQQLLATSVITTSTTTRKG